MIMDDPGATRFEAYPDDEYKLTFSTFSPLLVGGKTTLMAIRFFKEDSMRAAIAFLGERQHLWPEWAVIAAEHGGNYLSGVLADLITADAVKRFGSDKYFLEACTGTRVDSFGESAIQLKMTLVTRSITVIEHAFRDRRTWAAFMESQVLGDRFEGAVELAELGLLRGRTVLANKLDFMAATRAETYSTSKH